MAKKMEVVEDGKLGIYSFCKTPHPTDGEACGWVSKYVDSKEEAIGLHANHYRQEHVVVRV